MDFFLSGLWWGLFVGGSVSFTAYQLGRTGSGLWKNKLQGFGGLFTLLFVVFSFIFTGWQGGLAVFIGMILVAVVGVLTIRLILRRRA